MQMTYIPDLSKYTYADSAYYRPVTKAVGWLSGAHDFEIASPLDASLDLLWKYCKVSVAQMRGFHDCELCPSPYLAARDKPSLLLALKQADSVRLAKRNGEELLLGSAEIRVFGNGDLIYAAPNLIYHYVSVHRYSPPEEFLKALHESPTPPAPEYFKRLSKLNLG